MPQSQVIDPELEIRVFDLQAAAFSTSSMCDMRAAAQTSKHGQQMLAGPHFLYGSPAPRRFESQINFSVRRLSSQLRKLVTDAEVEETLKQLQSQQGVQGPLVVNTEGIPTTTQDATSTDNPTTTQDASLMYSFILKARSTVHDIDPQNDLIFLQIRSKKNEIMVAPDKDYFLIVIQNPTE
nr:PREDICTED: dynein light chain roadblock-type 1-like [Rhinolophus sinicus]